MGQSSEIVILFFDIQCTWIEVSESRDIAGDLFAVYWRLSDIVILQWPWLSEE